MSAAASNTEQPVDMGTPHTDELLLEDLGLMGDGVEIQYLAVEEEPTITNTYVSAAPDFIRMPLSLPLIDHLIQLKQAAQERSQHSLLGQVRQEIGAIMKTHCTKAVNENNVYLEMYHYSNTPSRNKVVNWYGVVLKLHQVILLSGAYPQLKQIATKYTEERKRNAADTAGERSRTSTPTPAQIQTPTPSTSPTPPGTSTPTQTPTPTDNSAEVVLPPWLDFIVHWHNPHEPKELLKPWQTKDADIGLYVPLELVLFTLNSHGSHDHYFQALVQRAVYSAGVAYQAAEKGAIDTVITELTEKLGTAPIEKRSSRLAHLYNDALIHRVDNKKCDKYVEMLTSDERITIKDALSAIEQDLEHLILAQDRRSLKHIERVLVAGLGHESAAVAEDCTRLLNVLYDGNHWQLHDAFEATIAYIDDPFEVSLKVPEGVNLNPQHVILLVRSPPRVMTNRNSTLTRHQITWVPGSQTLRAVLGKFHRSGYYDWRIVTASDDGKHVPLWVTYPKITSKLAQGRFIIHPKLINEKIHHVFVDTEGASVEFVTLTEDVASKPAKVELLEKFQEIELRDVDKKDKAEKGGSVMKKSIEKYVVKKGSFKTVVDSLESYKSAGITMLVLSGALERPDDQPPHLTSDRSMPKMAHGGPDGLRTLVDKARQIGIKVAMEADLDICATGMHRKYTPLLCHTLPPVYTPSLLLNYRKVETWDMIAQELGYLVRQYSLKGFALANAHLLPYCQERNLPELYRLDPDGQRHYSPLEILSGEVVVAAGDAGEIMKNGYWRTSKKYPNPFWIKLTRELWGKFPNFTFFAEYSYSCERHVEATKCGIIPYDYSLYDAVNHIYSKKGSAVHLYKMFDSWTKYPKGVIPISPFSSGDIGYPLATMPTYLAQIFVELNYTLPVIPSTYSGEFKGFLRVVNPNDPQSVNQIKSSVDYSNLVNLAAARSTLRSAQAVLLKGGAPIPIRGYHKYGLSDQIFAFCRVHNNTLGVFAINIGDFTNIFFLDFQPIKDYLPEQSEIFEVYDMLNPSVPNKPLHYLTYEDLVNWKYPVNLKPSEFIYWEVSPQIVVSSRKLLFTDSIARLMNILREDVDPSHNFIYQLLAKGFTNIHEFGISLEKVMEELPLASDQDILPADMHLIYYHMTKNNQANENKIIGFLKALVRMGKNPSTRDLAKRILATNTIGPIVFVCPELGKWSTAGGLGVMVDELTQDLADLGCDVTVVSPYYNRNRKGEYNYLGEGIHWVHNIQTWIGAERVEIGVHEGRINNVHLLFLHNIHYFPHIYASGSPQYQLKTIVLMAKASLEALCRMRLIPAILVTNDWFTGLTAAYAKFSNSFNNTFHGTTFIHLIHNLGEGYQGLIWPEKGESMNNIHHLDNELLIDPYWSRMIINPSRCALLTSDTWATVSPSYKTDLMNSSTLSPLLRRHYAPLAVSNGIRKNQRQEALAKVASSHEEAKAKLQKLYFGMVDPKIPVFAFVGRITEQKGVHLIVEAAAELIFKNKQQIQILVGGVADRSEPYARMCAERLDALRLQFPENFWADPNAFFTNGTLINLGADFGLMPSLFEPGGVVQHEFFVAGTPVIAFRTGGLKDTVHEYLPSTGKGNGFTFEAHAKGDLFWAVDRAVGIYNQPAVYEKLRKNAYDSVITTKEVAWAWFKEISRQRKKIAANEEDAKVIAEVAEAELAKTGPVIPTPQHSPATTPPSTPKMMHMTSALPTHTLQPLNAPIAQVPSASIPSPAASIPSPSPSPTTSTPPSAPSTTPPASAPIPIPSRPSPTKATDASTSESKSQSK